MNILFHANDPMFPPFHTKWHVPKQKYYVTPKQT